jgi:hypothetical protein
MKVKYKGTHSIMLDSPNFCGVVNKDDIVDMCEQTYNERKAITENGIKIWSKIKKEVKEQPESIIKQ